MKATWNYKVTPYRIELNGQGYYFQTQEDLNNFFLDRNLKNRTVEFADPKGKGTVERVLHFPRRF